MKVNQNVLCRKPANDEQCVNMLLFCVSEVFMVLVIAIAFVLAVAIVTTGIVCLYRYVYKTVQATLALNVYD